MLPLLPPSLLTSGTSALPLRKRPPVRARCGKARPVRPKLARERAPKVAKVAKVVRAPKVGKVEKVAKEKLQAKCPKLPSSDPSMRLMSLPAEKRTARGLMWAVGEIGGQHPNF